MIAIVEHGDVPALAQARQKAQQGARALREFHPIDQLVLHHQAHARPPYSGYAVWPPRCRSCPRWRNRAAARSASSSARSSPPGTTDRPTNTWAEPASRVAIVELGDIAPTQSTAKAPEAAGLFRDGDTDHCLAVFAHFGALRDIAQPIEIGIGATDNRQQLLPANPVRSTYFFRPARAKAPAGSAILRVSSKMSLMAAHISSVTDGDDLVHRVANHAKGSLPTWATAQPSANRPTSGSVPGAPAPVPAAGRRHLRAQHQ